MSFDTLKLNGSTYSREELALLVEGMLQLKKISEYEKSFLQFIKEWISPDKTIKVKTSGSTGTPKVIEVQKKHMLESAKMTCNYFHITKRTNMLLCLSAEFIAGKMMLVRAFYSGANLITVKPDNNPLKELKDRIDFAAMVPLQVENILASPKTKKVFKNIDNVIIGGASVPEKLERKLSKCPNNVCSSFAMTETLSHFALRRLSGKGKNDFFEFLTGITIEKDKRDCMIIKAPLLNDEPIVTNDIIEIIDAKHFHWLGRYDNVINSGGVKVYPEELEKKVAGKIKQNRFFLASLPDKKLGEKVVIVIEGISKRDVSKIKKDVEQVLGKYEKPREYFTSKKFEETPTGKVKRKETLKMLTVKAK
jgi:O-succinylbenzoic acid--CoA ligase